MIHPDPDHPRNWGLEGYENYLPSENSGHKDKRQRPLARLRLAEARYENQLQRAVFI